MWREDEGCEELVRRKADMDVSGVWQRQTQRCTEYSSPLKSCMDRALENEKYSYLTEDAENTIVNNAGAES